MKNFMNAQIPMKGEISMTFTKTSISYRVAFDSSTNRFMAIDAMNEQHIAYGITIEQAVKALHESN
ncbi:Uncharacterised protein [Enterococcus mundtii]|nr:Uncharacterised protein [Enterococcus mundtii]